MEDGPPDERTRLVAAEVIKGSSVDGADALLDQLPATRVLGGLPTFLDLAVAPSAPRSRCPDGPLPGSAVVLDDSGQPIGEILVWVEHGYLSAVEYAWYTDEPPLEWPSPEALRLEPSSSA
jgi:hypothetical protein